MRWEGEGKWIAHVLHEAGLAKSSSDARRLIAQGAVTVNDERVVDEKTELFRNGSYLIKVGKKRFVTVIPC